jgi:hypothetical protein
MTPDVVRNHVVALHVPTPAAPLNPDELDQIEWRAKAMRAALLNRPAPIRPGFWGKVKKLALRVYAWFLDHKNYQNAIRDMSMRICVLEDFIEANDLRVPGGRSDE